MLAVRLHGPRDLRCDELPEPGRPGPGEALLRVLSVGICGSDLHTYADGRIGDTVVSAPFVPGHEFSAEVLAVGPDAADGFDRPLSPGQRVAVDPALACWRCDMCEAGHPNLCRRIRFAGHFPVDGALRQRFVHRARECFPLPDGLSSDAGALLEMLGVAAHAVDLGHIALGDTVGVIGCGPLGACVVRLARLAGASRVYAAERLPWRIELARKWGADAVADASREDVVGAFNELTEGRGLDVVFEVAWGDESVDWAVEAAGMGARVILVGVSSDDRVVFRNSTARRKGLTLASCRRMKNAYPRTIDLAVSGAVDLDSLVTHRYPLTQAALAFEAASEYRGNIVKAVIDASQEV